MYRVPTRTAKDTDRINAHRLTATDDTRDRYVLDTEPRVTVRREFTGPFLDDVEWVGYLDGVEVTRQGWANLAADVALAGVAS